ncbi:DUF421 domain-containing protein [Bacillus dakarensis]|uniref:DUF421 domain-containing protein n=1 Tax=Robertmurraya dakarensis TaxID=1926278 RepID=UPI0009824817|nr:DUF421 domain-containing protein [Bacillus dakarensis]
MDFFEILIELVFGFFALLLLTKMLGRTQITQITAFDFISAIVLGELVGNALYDNETGIGKVLFAVAIWGLLIFSTEMITQKSRKFRRVLEGEPSIVIRKGKIDYKILKGAHLDLNQLQHLLRSKDIFSVTECEYAILETDGKLSVLKKPNFASVTAADLNLPLNSVTLPVTVVLDGEILFDNLKMINWDTTKLLSELKSNGVHSVKEVLYAEWQEGKPLHVQKH